MDNNSNIFMHCTKVLIFIWNRWLGWKGLWLGMGHKGYVMGAGEGVHDGTLGGQFNLPIN